jgi:hypothetical protein
MNAVARRRSGQGLLAVLMVAVVMVSMPGMVSADPGLDAPELYSPGAGHSGDLILVWVKVTNATSYTAQVAMDADFTSPMSLNTDLGRVTFTGLVNGWYYCRVMAKQDAVNSNWSEVKQVRVHDDPKLAATSFTSMTINGGNVTCQWSAIPSAGRYMVEICTDPDFDPPIYHADTTDTVWTFSNLSGGIYQVRVCGYNATAWSDWTTATVLIGQGSVGPSIIPLAIIAAAVLVVLSLVFLVSRRRKR